MIESHETETNMQKITPHLWFEDNAEEAAKFYISFFKNSRVIDITHYGESAAEVSRRSKGTVMTVTFELEGQRFMALNGGPMLGVLTRITTAIFIIEMMGTTLVVWLSQGFAGGPLIKQSAIHYQK